MLNFESIEGSNTKVVFHPNPKGIIQLIGGFISGSFPEHKFKFLLRNLYNQGYSLIIYHFPFRPLQFNHWSVAIKILKDLYVVRFEIIKKLFCTSMANEKLKVYIENKNYFWLGYSLGCKYILLLELLSNDHDSFQRRNQILRSCLGIENFQKIKLDIDEADHYRKMTIKNISELMGLSCQINPLIKGQPSLLIAPEINNTVQIAGKSLALFSFWDFPSRQQIQHLIKSSTEIFNLMGLISFNQDKIAEDDVKFLKCQLQRYNLMPFLHHKLPGKHDYPLKSNVNNLVLHIDTIFQELVKRQYY